MTIFDILNSVLFTKNKNCLATQDEESAFIPYMVNRWSSMYSPSVALKSNILNKYLAVFEEKKSLYSLFLNVLPKVKAKRINYFKKQKEQQSELDEKLPLVAKNMELSQREIQSYIAFSKK